MFKSFTTFASLVFVLSSGLVSCAPEKKKREEPKTTTVQDVYKAPPPKVISNKNQTGLKDWIAEHSKELDLQDSFDLTEAAPARAVIAAHCMVKNVEHVQEFSFTNPHAISIFQILPDELLIRNFETSPVACSFELNLFNSLGSNHIYTIYSTPVVEKRPSGVRLEHENPVKGNDARHISMPANKIDGLTIRFATGATDVTAQLNCEAITYPVARFNQIMEFKAFDLTTPQLRTGWTALDLSKNPVQLCRVLIGSGHELLAVSDWLQMIFPLPNMAVNIDSSFGSSAEDKFSAMLTGRAMSVGTWEVLNQETYPRYLKFNKIPYVTETHAFDSQRGNLTYRSRAITLQPYGSVKVVADDGEAFTVEVAAGGSAMVLAWFQPKGAPQCGLGLRGFVLQTAMSVNATDMTRDGKELGIVHIDPHPTFFIGGRDYVTSLWQSQSPLPGPQLCPWL